jgi:hypothetical protein
MEGGNLPDSPGGWPIPTVRSLCGGFRAGKMAISRIGVTQPAGNLSLENDKIQGEFFDVHTHMKYTVNAGVKGNAIEGTFVSTKDVAAGPGGKIVGVMSTESDLKKANAIAAGKDWPCWSGPGTSQMATPCGLKLVDSLDQARLVWRSEEATPNSLGTITRGMKLCADAFHKRTSGGGSSPIVADGKMFLIYHVPSGDALDADATAVLASIKQSHPAITSIPPEALEKLKARADDVVLCLDAATGKTLWKTVFKNAGGNPQNHKTGPSNNTPCFGGGKVFALGVGGILHGLDATTGKSLWDVKIGPDVMGGFDGSSAPVYCGGVVVCGDHRGSMHGVDPNTGKLLWKAVCSKDAVPNVWTSNGKEYVLAVSGHGLVGIEPKTGKELWKVGGTFFGFGGSVHAV